MKNKFVYTILVGSSIAIGSINFTVFADNISPEDTNPSYTIQAKNAAYAAWQAAPDLGVTSKIRNVLSSKADAMVLDLSNEIGEKAKGLLHQKIYRLVDRHTTDLYGKKTGYVEMDNAQLVRSIIKKVVGVDLESVADFGFGTKAVAKFVLDKLENQVAAILKSGIQTQMAEKTHYAVMKSLGLALQFSEDRISNLLSTVPVSNDVSIKDIEAKASNVAQSGITADVANALNNNVHLQKIISGMKANVSLWFLNQAEQSAHELSDWAAGQIIDKSMKSAQTAVTVAGGIVVAPVSVGLAGLYGVMVSTDASMSDDKNPSYMRQFVNWAFGATENQKKIQLSVEANAMNILHKAYNQYFGNYEKDIETIYGETVSNNVNHADIGGDWVVIDKVSDGFSIVEELKAIAADTLVVVKGGAIAVLTAIPNKIAEDNKIMAEEVEKRGGGFMNILGVFLEAMNQGIEFEEEEVADDQVQPSDDFDYQAEIEKGYGNGAQDSDAESAQPKSWWNIW